MPWDVEQTGECPASRPWGVVRRTDGQIEGCHATEEAAREQQAALYVSETESARRRVGMSQQKALTGLKITDADKGLVEALFSTFDVVDHDGDVTEKGAFGDQKVRISAYNHGSWHGALPVGKGIISETDGGAVLKGQFFLDTTAGRDTFEVVKEMGDLQEWSYGYDVIEAEQGTKDGQDVQVLKKLKVHEVSPVLLGAGIDTRTLAVKGLVGKDDTAALVKALLEKDPDEVADAIAAGEIKLADQIILAAALGEKAAERVAEVATKRADDNKGLGEDTREACARLVKASDPVRPLLHVEPDMNREALEAHARVAKALSLLASRKERD